MQMLAPEALDAIGNKYQKTEAATHGTKHLVDKMLFNYQWVGIIRLALPNAKIIHCTRIRAISACLSGRPISRAASSNGDMTLKTSVVTIAPIRKMAHWDKLFPGEIYEVNYEKLVANPEPEIRKLLEFCGLPWNDKCLKFHETERVVKTASLNQVRRPLYGDSAGKWKKYENYLTPSSRPLKNLNWLAFASFYIRF